MYKLKLLLSTLTIAFGIFLIILGGIDDSPGGQMVGLVVIVLTIVALVRNKKINS